MIVIHIGGRIGSLFSVYHEKDADANFAAEYLRIVLSSLKIIGTHYHEATV